MIYEKSCGAVVFTRINNEIKYLLIRNLTGIYGFPKGHVEQGETEEQTALREVFEEVGLAVKLVSGFRSEDEHPIPQKENTMKQIVYFLGEYSNQEFTYQIEELTDALLTDYETAMTLFQFDSSKRILTEANNFLLSR
jgi:NADH pyrophosphatase NudC (nudix superfamily)